MVEGSFRGRNEEDKKVIELACYPLSHVSADVHGAVAEHLSVIKCHFEV
jgi:hypothetical protein